MFPLPFPKEQKACRPGRIPPGNVRASGANSLSNAVSREDLRWPPWTKRGRPPLCRGPDARWEFRRSKECRACASRAGTGDSRPTNCGKDRNVRWRADARRSSRDTFSLRHNSKGDREKRSGAPDASEAIESNGPVSASGDWPADEWSFGPITRVGGGSALEFANEMKRQASNSQCDVLMSLERIWSCDLYRAGDGVHRAWLARRAEIGGPWQKLSRLMN